VIVDVTRLNSGIVKEILVDMTYEFSDDNLSGTDILKIKDFKVFGKVKKNVLDDIYLELNISGIMVMPCAVTLKPVDHEFNVDIEGIYSELLEETGENLKNSLNRLEIFPIIWENILLETPIRVVSDEAKDIELSGDGWVLDKNNDVVSNNPFMSLLDDERE